MKKSFYPLALTAALAIMGCGNNSTTEATNSSNTLETAVDNTMTREATTNQDTTFATKAAIGGMAEVELSQLALEKTSNAKVKDFATMMVKDHSKANDELKAIASSKNIVLPTSLDAEHAKVKEELTAKKGAEFDKAYVKTMVEDHQKTLDLMEDGSNNNQDPELRGFAAKTAPVVKHHLDIIQKIQSELK